MNTGFLQLVSWRAVHDAKHGWGVLLEDSNGASVQRNYIFLHGHGDEKNAWAHAKELNEALAWSSTDFNWGRV